MEGNRRKGGRRGREGESWSILSVDSNQNVESQDESKIEKMCSPELTAFDTSRNSLF